jgi:hypothetical protein
MKWASKYDGKGLDFWHRVYWSNECSIERGKDGQIQWVYRQRQVYPTFLLQFITSTINAQLISNFLQVKL